MDKVTKGQRKKIERPESTAKEPQAAPSFQGQGEDGNHQRLRKSSRRDR